MKHVLLLFFVLASAISHSQLSGDLATSKRPILKDFACEITGNKTGLLVFDISVDEKGKVISVKLDKVASSFYSTPLIVKATNHIKTNLTFKADSQYPQFHTGTVTITVVKP